MAKKDYPGGVMVTVEDDESPKLASKAKNPKPDAKEEAEEKAEGLELRRIEIEPAENGFVLTEILEGGKEPGYAPPDKKVFTDAKSLCAYIMSELDAHAE